MRITPIRNSGRDVTCALCERGLCVRHVYSFSDWNSSNKVVINAKLVSSITQTQHSSQKTKREKTKTRSGKEKTWAKDDRTEKCFISAGAFNLSKNGGQKVFLKEKDKKAVGTETDKDTEGVRAVFMTARRRESGKGAGHWETRVNYWHSASARAAGARVCSGPVQQTRIQGREKNKGTCTPKFRERERKSAREAEREWERERERETDRERDREREKEKQRERERETDRQRERQREREREAERESEREKERDRERERERAFAGIRRKTLNLFGGKIPIVYQFLSKLFFPFRQVNLYTEQENEWFFVKCPVFSCCQK